MKTNFVKITTVGLLFGIAMLVNTNNASAQQVTEPVAQLNQPCEPHYRSHPQNKQRGEQQKNVEAQRIAFITQELSLTPDEAKVFWPVYNEYDAKRHDLKKSLKGAEKLHKEEIVKLTEKEASQLLDNQLIEAQKLLDLRKEYNGKFKTVLPSVKVLQLYDAEREFQKILMEKISKHKQQGKTPAGKPSDKK